MASEVQAACERLKNELERHEPDVRSFRPEAADVRIVLATVDAQRKEIERLCSVARDSLDGLEGCEADARSIAVRIREALLFGVTPAVMLATKKELEIPESEIDVALRGE